MKHTQKGVLSVNSSTHDTTAYYPTKLRLRTMFKVYIGENCVMVYTYEDSSDEEILQLAKEVLDGEYC